MHEPLNRPLLAAAALLGALIAGCQPQYAEEVTTAELRANCLARFEAPENAAVKAELTGLMERRQIEAIECAEHGEQLEAIRIIDGLAQDEAPAAAGLIFEEVR